MKRMLMMAVAMERESTSIESSLLSLFVGVSSLLWGEEEGEEGLRLSPLKREREENLGLFSYLSLFDYLIDS